MSRAGDNGYDLLRNVKGNLGKFTIIAIHRSFFWRKARVYYTLSISRGGGGAAPSP